MAPGRSRKLDGCPLNPNPYQVRYEPIRMVFFCGQCGARVTGDMKFCEQCGAHLRINPESSPAPAPVPPPASTTTGNLTKDTIPPGMAEKYAGSEFIGKGNFARVFKAKRKDGIYVAVKLPLYLDEWKGRSFIAEMQNWMEFDHPNIVKIYDFNVMPFPYFEEEFCDSSLNKIKKPLDPAKAAWIMFNVCEGLKYAHARQVIHCDLKPQNILLKKDAPKISGWGLSEVLNDSTSSETTAFTPYYAAPEQVTNKPKDQRTDIWQVGVILYELVTGSLPFTGDNIIETIEKIATRDPVPPGDINPDAKTIELMILRCMEKDPLSRYQSVADLQKDLAVFLKMDFGESLQPGIETKKVCPECSTVHTPSATVCRKCGYQFSRQLPSKDRDIAPAKIGRNDMAVADISPGKVDKATAVDYYSRGCELDKLGRHAEALESYDKEIKINPNYYSAWYNRGNALLKLRRYDEAVKSYDQAVKIKPDESDAWGNRGLALDVLGRTVEAFESYDQAFKIKPDDFVGLLGRGTALAKLGRHAEAIASFDQALKIKPDDSKAWANRGIALNDLGRHAEALTSLDQALKINPEYFNAWYNRGNALRELGRYAEAIESYDEMLKIKPDEPNAWGNRGIALVELGRYDEALVSYDRALKINPNKFNEWNNRGIALDDLGRHDEAVASYDKALKIKPDYFNAFANRGNALAKLGRYTETVATFDQALKINPNNSKVWYFRGIALGNLGRHAEAVASYDKALKINPDDSDALQNRGIALGKLGQNAGTVASTTQGKGTGTARIPQQNTKSASSNLGITTLPGAMFRANLQHTGEYDNGGLVLTNTELWRFQTGGKVYSSPAVSNGVVYVGSYDYNLYAIDAVTGKELWRFQTGLCEVHSSPAVSDGIIYVGSYDYNLYAIDAVTGKEKWRFETESCLDSSPAVSDGIVYVGSADGNLYAIDAVTGKEKWRFQTGDWVVSSPAVSDGIVYVGSGDGNLYAIDAVTGKELWRLETGSCVSTAPAVSDGIVYAGSGDGNLYAINAVTGKELWRFEMGSSVISSPAVLNGITYIGNDDLLYAIDAVTGKEKWRFQTGGDVDSSPSVSNSIVYVGSKDKNLYAIDAVTGKEKWRFQTGGDVDSSPSVSNGIVYVGSDDKNLYAVGIYQAVLPQAGTEKVADFKEKAPKRPAETEPLVPSPENTTPSATPELFITLNQIPLTQSVWHMIEVQVTNTGKAHAFSVILSFSDDFETQLIKPVTVDAGTTNVIEIGIIPKAPGTIPIEVTLQYKDESNHDYVTTSEFWVEVQPKNTTS